MSRFAVAVSRFGFAVGTPASGGAERNFIRPVYPLDHGRRWWVIFLAEASADFRATEHVVT